MDKPEITIGFEETPKGGRYVAHVAGKPDSEMVFVRKDASVWTITHTEVPEALSGLGVGKALVAHMVEDVRRRGVKIVAQCPFAAAMLKRRPEWQDILAAPL